MSSTPFFRRGTVSALAVSLLLLAGCAAQTFHQEGLQAMDRKQYADGVLKLGKAVELKNSDVFYRKDYLRARDAKKSDPLGS